jgi:hypothetical protein
MQLSKFAKCAIAIMAFTICVTFFLSFFSCYTALLEGMSLQCKPAELVETVGTFNDYSIIAVMDYNTLLCTDKSNSDLYVMTVSGDSWNDVSWFDIFTYGFKSDALSYIDIVSCDRYVADVSIADVSK